MEKYKKIIKVLRSIKNKKLFHTAVSVLINRATRVSIKNNDSYEYLGYNLDINSNRSLTGNNGFDVKYAWSDFIPRDTKLVIGISQLEDYSYRCGGYYYYNDDLTYIYEFFKYIIDYDVKDVNHLDILVFNFIKEFLGLKFNDSDERDAKRDQVETLLKNDDDYYYKRIKDHSIKDFYGNDAAMCSEISLLVQNIYSILGFDMIYMIDNTHAYNIRVFDDKVEIVDFSNYIDVVDLNFRYIGSLPFIEEFPDSSDDFIVGFLERNFCLVFSEMFAQKVNDKYYFFPSRSGEREYGGRDDDIFDVVKSEDDKPLELDLLNDDDDEKEIILNDDYKRYTKIMSTYDEFNVKKLTRKR